MNSLHIYISVLLYSWLYAGNWAGIKEMKKPFLEVQQ